MHGDIDVNDVVIR